MPPEAITPADCAKCRELLLSTLSETRADLKARIKELMEESAPNRQRMAEILAELSQLSGALRAVEARLESETGTRERQIDKLEKALSDQGEKSDRRLAEQITQLEDRLARRLDDQARMQRTELATSIGLIGDRLTAATDQMKRDIATATSTATVQAQTATESRLWALAWKVGPILLALLAGGGGLSLLQDDAAEVQKAASEAARKALIDVLHEAKGEGAPGPLGLPPAPTEAKP